MDVAPDPLITVPFGPKDPNALPYDTNSGQVQLPGAAFTVDITNTSTVSHTFDVVVTGLPEGWLVLSGNEGYTQTTVTLPAGGIGQVGLYVSPTVTTLPPVGTEYPFDVDVTAVDYPTLQETDSDVFTVPAIPFNYVTTAPPLVYAAPDSSADFDLAVKNVGNVSGTFPITVTLPVTTWTISNIQSPIPNIPAGDTFIQTVTFTATGSALGDEETIRIDSPAPGTAYTQTAYALVRVVGPCVVGAYQAVQAAALLDNTSLGQALENLAFQLERWEQDPENTVLRDRTVAALEDVIARLQSTYPLADTGALESLAASPTIAGFCAPLAVLADQLTTIAHHDVALSLQPGFDATLVDHPITYTLTLENRGTLTTTYDLSIDAPDVLRFTFHVSRTTLSPGQQFTTPVVLTPTVLGYHTIAADVEAVEAEMIHAEATAGLNAVDRFIQVVAVHADPDFVEIGPNPVDLYAHVANVAGVYQYAQAEVSVLSPEGVAVFTNTVPVTLIPSVDVQGLSLGTIPISNTQYLTPGVYTITLDITDQSGSPTCGEQCRTIPNGSGYGHLHAGTGIKFSAGVQPAIVTPGTVTATTTITAQPTTQPTNQLPNQPPTQPPNQLSNQYTFYLPRDIAHADHEGFYVVGLRPETTYVVQRFDDETTNTWVHVLTSTVAMDEVNLHFAGFTHDKLYRVYGSEPLLVVVTSGEGSLVSAATHDLDFRGQHFVFLGDYAGTDGNSRAVVFALQDSTTVTMEVRAYESDWTTPISSTTRTIDADGYWFHEFETGANTTVVRVTADRDVIAYRTGNDNDELDTAISADGTPYGKVFYFAPVPHEYNNVILLFNTEPLTATATVYGLDTSYVYTATLQPYSAGAVFVGHQAEYFKIVSDRTLSVVGGGDGWGQLKPDGITTDAIWEIMPIPVGDMYLYQTDLLYARNKPLSQKYTEFQANALRDTEIGTSIPLIDKSTGHLWHENGLSYLASEPFTITLEVISRTIPSGIFRHEEDYDVHYTPAPWAQASHGRVSQGDYAYSNAAGATASLTFYGTWASLGFLTRSNGGLAEVFIDGVSQGVVDTYSRVEDVKSVTYAGLTTGTHTISVTVLGDRNDFSQGNDVRLDYVDTWGGAAMEEGVFEEDDENGRVLRSPDWAQYTNAAASGGTYYGHSANNPSNAWFPFTGSSVTYRAMAHSEAGQVEILIDGQSIGFFDLYHPNYHTSAVTRTLSFDDLGPGPHVLHVKSYRGQATVDAFITPGIPPFYEPPESTGVVRYEEDDPALRYNGFPLQQAPISWATPRNDRLSARYAAWSRTLSDAVSLTFDGTWVGVGFWTRSDGGPADVYIDGVLTDTVDTYSSSESVTSTYYTGLSTSTHVISISVQQQNQSVFVDYIDAWDGTEMAGGTFEEDDPRVHLSFGWQPTSHGGASGGAFIRRLYNGWFRFTGDEVTYRAMACNEAGVVDILIDGVVQTSVDLYDPVSCSSAITQAHTYDGLGAGPHVIQIRSNQQKGTLDAFVAPGETASIIHSPGRKPLAALRQGQGIAPGPMPGFSSPDEGADVDLVLDGAPPFQTLSEAGIHTITLPAGRHSLDFIADRGDVVLKGFALDASASLVWNLDDIPPGTWGFQHDQDLWPQAPFWPFIANVPFHFLQGGSGNCWIHTILPYEYGESYHLQIDHRVPLAGVQTLTGTFSTTPITTTVGVEETVYTWQHELIPSQQTYTITFDALLADMGPGEVRQVSNGTLFNYTTLGGQGQATLPPLYVAASHLVSVSPPVQTTNPGGVVHYQVTLYNPLATTDVFTLTLEGLPTGWTVQGAPTTLLVGAGAEVIVSVDVTVPAYAALGDYAFAAAVETGSGSHDAVQGQVTVADLVEIAAEPSLLAGGHGETVTYTLAIANLEAVSRTYALSVGGLGENDVELPATLDVEASGSTTATLRVTALDVRGLYPFQVTATYETPEQTVQSRAEATLVVLSEPGVEVGLDPDAATGGRGSPAAYTMTVTNTGSLADTYDLAVGLPEGWSAELSANGTPVSEITLTPYIFNAAPLQLVVVPASDATPGSYTFVVTATSRADPGTSFTLAGTTDVSQYGVTVQISPQSTTMSPPGTQNWDVLVTNTGTQVDTFELMAGGIVSSTAQFSADPVTLSAGSSTVVQLTAGPLEFALAQSYPFAVTALSQGETDVFGYDTAEVTFEEFEAVDVGMLPVSQTITDTFQASYLMIITNTGNVDTVYAFSASSDPALG
ncbi:MAG: hypothetical protein SXV54_00630, partial [Chloroflexota bacterium]|nr:hypothetical protein [Chloroflexota bacterium]